MTICCCSITFNQQIPKWQCSFKIKNIELCYWSNNWSLMTRAHISTLQAVELVFQVLKTLNQVWRVIRNKVDSIQTWFQMTYIQLRKNIVQSSSNWQSKMHLSASLFKTRLFLFHKRMTISFPESNIWNKKNWGYTHSLKK